ncbi:GFA family protein [uncultured Sneathiella sp.]|uniref:GFA family protein n=1 Tax=uncultured Sneathiella sp. TaxID=879315 RepID=UPI0030DA97A3
MTTYHASCSCGAIEIEADGEPVVQCYCHCNSCRSFTGCPVNAPVLWPRDKIRIVRGEDKLRHYSKTGHAEAGRYSCSICNGLVGINLFEAGLYDIFAGLVHDLTFTPTIHINYENAILPIKDGLPKFKDMPEEAGGSGEMMPE